MTSNQHQILGRVKEFYSSFYGDTVDQIAFDNVEKIDMPTVLPDEVKSAIQNLKNGKERGQDEIAGKILKSYGNETHRDLAYLFTQCLKQKDIQTSWKDAKVILLHKKKKQEDLKNYRPISILSVINKLLTRIIARRLETILDPSQPKEQAGFRSRYSTMYNI